MRTATDVPRKPRGAAGKKSASRPLAIGQRFIPTLVGNTRPDTAPMREKPVHPHWRFDNVTPRTDHGSNCFRLRFIGDPYYFRFFGVMEQVMKREIVNKLNWSKTDGAKRT